MALQKRSKENEKLIAFHGIKWPSPPSWSFFFPITPSVFFFQIFFFKFFFPFPLFSFLLFPFPLSPFSVLSLSTPPPSHCFPSTFTLLPLLLACSSLLPLLKR
ncbi:hypothetical protein F4815DRAFT_387570 [Daldinia loculata]|nr:hypothetical protein F4815DRAFT_387570 [Daldinia loculata]